MAEYTIKERGISLSKDEIMDKVCGIIGEVLEDQGQKNLDITPEAKLSEMGINSISFVTIIVQAELAFGIEFEDDCLNLEYFTNIVSIIDYIYNIKVDCWGDNFPR